MKRNNITRTALYGLFKSRDIYINTVLGVRVKVNKKHVKDSLRYLDKDSLISINYTDSKVVIL